MSSGRKPTIVWVTVVAITISMSGTSAVHAQQSSSPTLMDRFSAFKGAFKRDESSAQKSASTSSRQSSGRTRQNRPTPGSRRQPAANSGSRTNSSGASLPRIGLDDLLPNNIFGRKKSSSASGNQQRQRSVAVPSNQRAQNAVVDDDSAGGRPARTASPARMGSDNRSPSSRTQPRRSPTITYHDNLSDTLFDLLENETINSGELATETEYAAADDLQADASQAEPEQTVVASQEPVAIANEEATEQLSPESTAIASDYHTGESATAEEEPLAHTQIDLHDALLSDELYEDWAAEEAELAATPIADSDPAEIEDSLEIEGLIEANTPVAAQEQSLPFDQVVEVPNPITRLRKPGSDVLVSTEQPVIVSHVEGPRSILVGREASYRVTLENTSRTSAQNLSAAIHVPEWADLVDVTSTSGVVEQSEKGSGRLEWHLPELAAHSSQTLRLRLIPRSGREFQLGVQWSQQSTESHTSVEVLEPKLEMTIRGPQEVLFGLPQRYRLILSNPGTGPAEGVAVSLIPPGGDSASATTHTVGTLGPEEVKELELELTAREAGELIVQAIATAEGDLKSEATKRILCRKPELEIDWRGPDQKYAGTETTYYFRISNSGTATTEPVEVKVSLPEGIRFLSASDSYAVDAVTEVVTWRLPSLTPGEEQYVQFHCQLDRPGLKEFDVTARTINGDLHDTASVHTEVIALADLKLEVDDPRGAHPIGEPVLYEIRVVNRGTTDARGIAIVGLFSDGIEPVSVEGAQNMVREGRVTFQPVKSLPAGGEILLRIRAVASRAGTHIFRAEVVCEDLDVRLATEETTRFFEDEFHWDEGETPYTAEKSNSTKVR